LKSRRTSIGKMKKGEKKEKDFGKRNRLPVYRGVEGGRVLGG